VQTLRAPRRTEREPHRFLRLRPGGSRPRSRVLLVGILAVLTLAAAACSSKSSGGTTTPTTPVATAPTASPPSTTGGALTGKWSGSYSGAFSGTFTLHWVQTSTKLSGAINLSSAGGPVPLHGTVVGSSIRFGTVGSTAVTYTGTVSGNSMSGTYKVGTSGAGTGTWNATKTS